MGPAGADGADGADGTVGPAGRVIPVPGRSGPQGRRRRHRSLGRRRPDDYRSGGATLRSSGTPTGQTTVTFSFAAGERELPRLLCVHSDTDWSAQHVDVYLFVTSKTTLSGFTFVLNVANSDPMNAPAARRSIGSRSRRVGGPIRNGPRNARSRFYGAQRQIAATRSEPAQRSVRDRPSPREPSPGWPRPSPAVRPHLGGHEHIHSSPPVTARVASDPHRQRRRAGCLLQGLPAVRHRPRRR